MKPSGRDLYAGKYQADVVMQARWLRYGAGGKADSVELLCQSHGIAPGSIIEIGAGTGAVISELRARGIGASHTAMDFSSAALEYLSTAFPEIRTICGDVTTMAQQAPHDLAICSHVLEHLEEPELALAGIRANVPADHYVFEVPLEDLPLGRLRGGRYRKSNSAGHVQFFNPATFRALIAQDFRILGERIYCPRLSDEAFGFAMDRNNVHGIERGAKWLTRQVLPSVCGVVWTRFWHAHMAVIATAQ